jgi:hypothetical protein
VQAFELLSPAQQVTMNKECNEQRVRRVLRHYESQTDEEAAREDERTFKGQAIVQVPRELVPVIRELVRLYQARGKISAAHRKI